MSSIFQLIIVITLIYIAYKINLWFEEIYLFIKAEKEKDSKCSTLYPCHSRDEIQFLEKRSQIEFSKSIAIKDEIKLLIKKEVLQWNQANKNKTEFRFSASLLKKYGDWESAHGSYFYLWNEHWYMMRSNLLVLNGKSFAEAGRLALEEREVWTYDRGEQMKLRKIEEDINEAIEKWNRIIEEGS